MKRDSRWDVVKGILILCVLLRHFLVYGESLNYLTSQTAANFIHFFTMPLFVFVSGYFTKHVNETKRYWAGILGVVETYAVYQIFKGILYHYSIWQLISLPTLMMWYLLALAIWKITYFCLNRLGLVINGFFIAFLVLISLVIGFIPFIGEGFALSRIFYFAPYFFCGIMLQKVKVIDEIKIFLSAPIAWLILLLFLVGSYLASAYNVFYIVDGIFQGNEPYPDENKFLFMGCRILSYILSFLISISVLRLFAVPNRTLEMVGKDSLKYYIFHGFGIMAFGVLPVSWKYGLAFVYALIVSLIIFFFSKTKLSDFALRPIKYSMDFIKSKLNAIHNR